MPVSYFFIVYFNVILPFNPKPSICSPSFELIYQSPYTCVI